jgi:voltage-gated potassium channel
MPATLADITAIVSFLAPLAGEAAGFLRVLRTLRLLHTYQVFARLRADSAWFRRNEEVTIAIVHLAVFLFDNPSRSDRRHVPGGTTGMANSSRPASGR